MSAKLQDEKFEENGRNMEKNLFDFSLRIPHYLPFISGRVHLEIFIFY